MLILLFVLTVLLEVGLYSLSTLWVRRKALVPLLIILVGFVGGAVSFSHLNLLGGLFFLTSVFRVFNLLRIVEARMHPMYLHRTARRSGGIFISLQALIWLLIGFVHRLELPALQWWRLVAITQLIIALGVLLITLRNIMRTRYRPPGEHFADTELPPITVAIPARNETDDLEECLRTVLASDYPKLEVIVLDDCSQDRTPEIIRGFAQEGVRFVPGAEPAERWLAKNQAYEKLAAEASGEYILFCGVDVRFGPAAIRALVTTLLSRRQQMISVLPLRTTGSALNAFVQPTRYWWELALPRTVVKRPPVLSTCWIINRQALRQLGGFAAVSHAIIPEGFFARQLVRSNEYSFIRADDMLDVQTRKKAVDQRETAIRMLYPLIRRRPEMAYLLTLVDLGALLAPVVIFVAGFWTHLGLAQWLAGMATLCLVLTHTAIVRVTNSANTLIALLNYPLAVVLELVLGLTSMCKYEFSTVEWKGRNICIPVMHVIPKLPPSGPNKPS